MKSTEMMMGQKMTSEEFIALWKDNKLTERGGAQAHFDDRCDLIGVDKPRDPENYCFENGANKSGGGDGWADVWKRGCFGWENKKPGRDLSTALHQITNYALQLENPPLLVVCRLRLGGLYPGHVRRRDPAPSAGAEPGAVKGHRCRL